MKQLQYFIFFLASSGFVIFFFGLLIKSSQQIGDPRFARDFSSGVIICACLFLLAVCSGYMLLMSEGRLFFFNTILFLALAGVTLYGGEFAIRFFVPGWPAMGLHGVDPEIGRKSWGRVVDLDGGMGFNSWGQRDLERGLSADKGKYRIAFVGDSFLEESSTRPLSVVTESLLGKTDHEVLNLGVSATDPDEYYYRIKNIAFPLGVKEVFLFVYAGNDFIIKETLPSFRGIMAVYPREALLTVLGLRAINHVLTNKHRPVLNAWGRAGALNAQEQGFYQELQKVNDEKMPEVLASKGSPEKRSVIMKILRDRSLKDFFQSLRHPDTGLFRSYYLVWALNYLSLNDKEQPELSEEFAYIWIKKAADLCKRKDVKLTVVVIPEAFQVDARMNDIWMPLLNMREVFGAPRRDVVERFLKLCIADGIRFVDLYPYLKDVPGMYLNPDGHFSDKGVERVSGVLVDAIQKEAAGSGAVQ